MNKTTNRFPFSVFCIFVFLISTLCFGCDSTNIEMPDSIVAEVTTEPAAEEVTEATTEPVNEYATIERFVELFNDSSELAITDLTEMDIHGEDYLTEFRLFAFEKAVGLKGSLGDDSIQIVNYGTMGNTQIRFYAKVSDVDTANALTSSLVRILDNTIPEEEINSELENPYSIYLGDAGYISGYINTDYENGGVSGYDVMIDCTHINFQ